MAKPTEDAEIWFRHADQTGALIMFPHDMSEANRNAYVGECLHDLGKGLGHLAVGLRATYMLLEEVNRKLDQQRIAGR